MIWIRRKPPRYGRGWVQRVRDGSQKVYRSGDPVVVAPRLFGQRFHSMVLFNHRDRPLTASMRFRWPEGSARVVVDVPARGALPFTPREAGSERDDLFSDCDKILVEPRGSSGPCAATYFLSNEQLHVFFMNRRYRDELGAIVDRYAACDFTLLQGAFKRTVEPAFPDHDDAQRRLYDQVRRRFAESQRLLSARGFALPPARQIPRSFQWIWLRSPLPVRLTEAHVRMMDSWARHNPGFALNLWTDFPDLAPAFKSRSAHTLFHTLLGGRLRVRGPAEIDALFTGSTLANAGRLHDLVREATNVAARSDVLRLMILAGEGGVYCDMNDTECLAPIHEYCARFSVVAGLDCRHRIHNAILGSARDHPLVHDWLSSVQTTAAGLNEELGATDDRPRYFFAVLRAGGPYTLSHRLCALLEEGRIGSDVLLLPFPFFHNPHTHQPTPLSLATHHSAMSWMPPDSSMRTTVWLAAHYVRRRLRGLRRVS